jgi:fibronectin type 3 domain-containing protein
VDLQWTDSSPAVIGYYPYRATVTGGPYTKLSSSPTPQSSYADQGVQAGNTYFYVVTAVSADMVESAFSDEVQATVPTP